MSFENYIAARLTDKYINIYPKIAKVGLVILFGCSILAFLMVLASQKELVTLPANYLSAISSLFLITLFPSIPTVKYLVDSVNQSTSQLNFSQDIILAEKIKPLLKNLSANIIVGQYPSTEVNAFAISSIWKNNSVIAFSSELISRANEEQLLSIAAHEISHLKNGDGKNKTYILALNKALRFYPRLLSFSSHILIKPLIKIVAICTILMLVTEYSFSHTGATTSGLINWLLFVAKIFAYPAACIIGFIIFDYILNGLYFAYSRQREFVADADGADMTSHNDMISALSILSESAATIGIFDTHPPLALRISRLEN